MDNNELLESIENKPDYLLEELFDSYGDVLGKILQNYGLARQEALGLVSDTTFAVFSERTPESPELLLKHLLEMAVRMINEQKKTINIQNVLLTFDDTTDLFKLQTDDLCQRINDFLRGLDKEKRNIFIQAFYLGENEKDIAKRKKKSKKSIAAFLKKEKRAFNQSVQRAGHLSIPKTARERIMSGIDDRFLSDAIDDMNIPGIWREEKAEEKKSHKPTIIAGIILVAAAAAVGGIFLYKELNKKKLILGLGDFEIAKGSYLYPEKLRLEGETEATNGYEYVEAVFAYDSAGRVIEEKMITPVGVEHYWEFFYDDKGRLLSSNRDGEMVCTNTYDDENLIIDSKDLISSENKRTYYDEQLRSLKEIKYNDNGEATDTIEYDYSEKYIVGMKCYDKDGQLYYEAKTYGTGMNETVIYNWNTSAGESKSEHSYELDDEGRIKKIYQGDSTYSSQAVFEYDEDPVVVEGIPFPSSVTYHYSENQGEDMVYYYIFDGDHTLTCVSKQGEDEYKMECILVNISGNWIIAGTNYYDIDGKLSYVNKLEYDEHGKKIKEIVQYYSDDGEITTSAIIDRSAPGILKQSIIRENVTEENIICTDVMGRNLVSYAYYTNMMTYNALLGYESNDSFSVNLNNYNIEEVDTEEGKNTTITGSDGQKLTINYKEFEVK